MAARGLNKEDNNVGLTKKRRGQTLDAPRRGNNVGQEGERNNFGLRSYDFPPTTTLDKKRRRTRNFLFNFGDWSGGTTSATTTSKDVL